jgi:hypothetical protein
MKYIVYMVLIVVSLVPAWDLSYMRRSTFGTLEYLLRLERMLMLPSRQRFNKVKLTSTHVKNPFGVWTRGLISHEGCEILGLHHDSSWAI